MDAGLYHPEFWYQHGHWSYVNHTPGKLGRWKNFQFRVNDYSRREMDFVVIHEDVSSPLTLKAAEGCFIFVTGEERSVHTYMPEYLSQFDLIITSRDDIQHPNTIQTFYFNPWRVQKTYDELNGAKMPEKSRDLSAIVSHLQTLPLQKERVALLEKLKLNYGDRLSWFSKGGDGFVKDKWDGLAPFRYSVAIENSRHENYFTEKILDCFLACTLPLYAGCPNLGDFFDERSVVLIEPSNHLNTIEIIDEAIQNNFFAERQNFVQESRRLVLEKYHFIAAMSDVLEKTTMGSTRVQRKIYPQGYFSGTYQSPGLFQKLRNKITGR